MRAKEWAEEELRKRLDQLDPEQLVDTLIDIAKRSEEAAEHVQRLLATPGEKHQQMKARMRSLKRRQRFIHYRESSAFARELEMLLEDIKTSVHEVKAGIELVAGFFRMDGAILNRCDDSSGAISGVFRYDARELLVHYGSHCEDKAWLRDLILNLYGDDHYGVRDEVLNCAGRILPESELRQIVERLWESADAVDDHEEHAEYRRRHFIFGIESVARQLKDAKLFEQARLAAWPDISTAACMDIARVYFDTGDASAALSWLDRIPSDEEFQRGQQDELRYSIYEELGSQEQLEKTAWRIFRRLRNGRTLDMLLRAVGEDKCGTLLDGETSEILAAEQFSTADADFLAEIGRVDNAAEYLLKHADALNGDHYDALLPLAEQMEEHEQWLTATVLYRALLDSILRRAISKYYHHGVRYLRKLDKMQDKVGDWAAFPLHDAYKQALAAAHARKRSFWSKYGGLPT